jgi:hypothetical protein
MVLDDGESGRLGRPVGILASGQIKLRSVDGWRKIAAVLSPHMAAA